MIVALIVSACGPHTYSTYSAGKDNSSYIIVLSKEQQHKSVMVIVDGKSIPIKKVYKLKDTIKAHPIITEPGKHHIEVVSNGKTVLEENIIIGLQETKKIILE